MRVTIPFASVLLVASLSFIWATPIAVDRGSEIQQRSESHLNGRATDNEARAPIQGDGLLPEGGGDGLKEDRTKGKPKQAPESKSKGRVTGANGKVRLRYGEVRYFKLTQATKGDVDENVQKFVQKCLDETGIRATVRLPRSTGVFGVHPVAKFKLNFLDLKYKSNPKDKGETFTGFWNPTENYGEMYKDGELFYPPEINK